MGTHGRVPIIKIAKKEDQLSSNNREVIIAGIRDRGTASTRHPHPGLSRSWTRHRPVPTAVIVSAIGEGYPGAAAIPR